MPTTLPAASLSPTTAARPGSGTRERGPILWIGLWLTYSLGGLAYLAYQNPLLASICTSPP